MVETASAILESISHDSENSVIELKAENFVDENAENSPPMSQEDKDKESDRELKRNYAYWFIGILIAQLIIMNTVFIIVGLGYLKFEEHVLELYMGGTLAEVFGVIVVITKNLFPKKYN